MGEAKSDTRVSLDGVVKESPVKRPVFAPEAVVIGGGRRVGDDEAEEKVQPEPHNERDGFLVDCETK